MFRIKYFIVLILLSALNMGAGEKNSGIVPGDVFKIDTVHSFVMFKVSHLGFTNTYGRFTDVQGQFVIDNADPSTSTVNLKIKTSSLTTQDAKRDKHLLGADFFNAKINPEITFTSSKVKKMGERKYEVSGKLKMNGVENEETFVFNQNKTADFQGKLKTGGDIEFVIKRSKYKINYMLGDDKIPDDVTIIASIEGEKVN